jgi:hypothetical protein
MTPQINIDFDAKLLTKILCEGGVSVWNKFIEDLFDRDMVCTCWSSEERPPPVAIELDFSEAKLDDLNLDGIDLRWCSVAGASFNRTSLRVARIGYCKGASFREATLDGCEFIAESLDGCDFTGASGLNNAVFAEVAHAPASPPIGLPPDVLAQCATTVKRTYASQSAFPKTGKHEWYTKWPINSRASVWLLHLEEILHVGV